jgi:hypothetical protein
MYVLVSKNFDEISNLSILYLKFKNIVFVELIDTTYHKIILRNYYLEFM